MQTPQPDSAPPEQPLTPDKIGNRAKRLETFKWWSGCSLLIALPCLLCARSYFLTGHAASGLFVLKLAAGLVILYPVAIRLYGNVIEAGIPCGIISVLAVILYPVFLQAHTKAQAVGCLTNTKQLVVGVLMYAADYDDVLPNNAASFRTLVSPHVKDGKSFTCPLDPPGVNSYTFNSNLAGVSTRTIPSPNRTVLIYEGSAGKLNYRHEDRAVVGFVDGSCKFISPDQKLIGPNQAASLIWTVQVPAKK